MDSSRQPLPWIALLAVLFGGCAAETGTLRFGTMLAQTLVLLFGICALALVTLRWAARSGYGQRASGQRLEVLEELGVGARQSVIAVRAGSRVVLLSRTATGLGHLTDLDANDWNTTQRTFADVLADTPLPQEATIGEEVL